MTHYFIISRKILNLFFLILISTAVSAETIREFHERQCKEGKQDSCEHAREMKIGETHAAWVDELGLSFSKTVNRDELEEGNKPKLDLAYSIVLNDYFTADLQKNGRQHNVDESRLQYCAEHYHNYWRNKKLIWPVNEANEPDWATIYFFIVEHYYGYCLRQPF